MVKELPGESFYTSVFLSVSIPYINNISDKYAATGQYSKSLLKPKVAQ